MSRLPASSVDSIICDYNEFYSILLRRAAHVRCRQGVTIRQEEMRELKEREGLRSDARVALFLLDR